MEYDSGPRPTLWRTVSACACTRWKERTVATAAETRRIARLETARRICANSIHAARKAVSPSLRGRAGHSTLISTATYSPWLLDKAYRSAAATISGYSLLDDMRLYELWQLADQVGGLEGAGIEVGCWRGGAGALVAHRLTAARPGTEMFLCDTFSGVVKAGHKDRDYAGGEHGDADVASVREVAAKLGVADAVHVLVGVFPEDTGAQVEGRRFKFAHIDVDVYAGARDAFEWLWSRLVVGAVVVFDDYGGSATEGIRLFVDELHGRPGLVIVRNVNGQAVAVRTGGDSEAG